MLGGAIRAVKMQHLAYRADYCITIIGLGGGPGTPPVPGPLKARNRGLSAPRSGRGREGPSRQARTSDYDLKLLCSAPATWAGPELARGPRPGSPAERPAGDAD
jgi:hypothetical protein